MKSIATVAAALGAVASVSAITIAEINGNRYLSPWQDKDVKGVEGVVTAISKTGIYLRSTKPDDNPATSEGLFVYYGKTAVGQVKVGNVVSLNGVVKEYRGDETSIFLTEIVNPTNIKVVSADHEVKPLVIGVDTLHPPTKEYSSLDNGDIFGVPNAVAKVSEANPELDPTAYGLDFWESLTGELVTIKDAYQVSMTDNFGGVFVRGKWAITGQNGHGGVTMLQGDANPEAVYVGSALDGTKAPKDGKMGDFLGDVTGVVSYAFGKYQVLPLTAYKQVTAASSDFPALTLTSEGSCLGITIGSYNAENLAPTSKHMPSVVEQIVNQLRSPDIIFMQEIQDNSGPKDDGVTAADVTLSTLVDGIQKASGLNYSFVEIAPENNMDGGQPGGNIRPAYLYRPDIVELYKPKPGSTNDANEVVQGPALKFNPGRIGQEDPSFSATRKPLVAMWMPLKGTKKPFFTVNVHFTSKGGSTGLQGDQRPPVNGGVDKRTSQMELTANFIAEILAQDKKAMVITAGDFNDYAQVQPLKVFSQKSGLIDMDDAANIPAEERYTYVFDQNSQALDHMYVSRGASKGAQIEHLHLNSWVAKKLQTSDHDPSVAKLNLCGC